MLSFPITFLIYWIRLLLLLLLHVTKFSIQTGKLKHHLLWFMSQGCA